MPNFATVQNKRNVNRVYAKNTGGTWPGWWQGDDFAGRWTAKWRVDKGGKYIFRLGSDDGSRLYLNNQHILNNDGLHGFRVRQSGRTIKAGQLYSIRVHDESCSRQSEGRGIDAPSLVRARAFVAVFVSAIPSLTWADSGSVFMHLTTSIRSRTSLRRSETTRRFNSLDSHCN